MSPFLIGILVAIPLIVIQFFILRKVFKRFNDQNKKD